MKKSNETIGNRKRNLPACKTMSNHVFITCVKYIMSLKRSYLKKEPPIYSTKFWKLGLQKHVAHSTLIRISVNYETFALREITQLRLSRNVCTQQPNYKEQNSRKVNISTTQPPRPEIFFNYNIEA